MLAEETLRADFIDFLVGQRINDYYQNPLLLWSISIRRSLVEELAQFIRSLNKEVVIEYCCGAIYLPFNGKSRFQPSR
jgi:hypothetical protein